MCRAFPPEVHNLNSCLPHSSWDDLQDGKVIVPGNPPRHVDLYTTEDNLELPSGTPLPPRELCCSFHYASAALDPPSLPSKSGGLTSRLRVYAPDLSIASPISSRPILVMLWFFFGGLGLLLIYSILW